MIAKIAKKFFECLIFIGGVALICLMMYLVPFYATGEGIGISGVDCYAQCLIDYLPPVKYFQLFCGLIIMISFVLRCYLRTKLDEFA